jgi:glycosyltransferase involved in cell wall biosynthesis
MLPMKTVDVIIPCYNYGLFLAECVESVLSQTGVTVRVLIIDDASEDDSAPVAERLAADSRVSFIRHALNRGHIATYNEGLDWASAEYLLLLSADDYVLPRAFQRATSLMSANPAMSFTFGSVVALYSDTARTREIHPLAAYSDLVMSGVDFIKRSAAKNLVVTPSAIVRTSVQRRAGYYSAELPHSGDMEMWLRLAALGSVGYITTPQAVYRRHSANMDWAYNPLEDLRQRELAIEGFFVHCRPMIPDALSLERRIKYELAKDALRTAAEVIGSEKSAPLSQDLANFAHRVDPAVWKSLAWLKYRARQVMIGPC